MASHEQTTNAELKDMITKLMSKVDTVSSDVKHLSHRLSEVEKSVESLERQVTAQPRDDLPQHLASDIQAMMNVQAAVLENVTTNNTFSLKFYGLGYKPHQQTMPLDTMFRYFMHDTLHIDQEKAFSMPIHVQYLPRMSQNDVLSPLCVTFRSREDKELVTKKAEKYKKTALRVQGISVTGFERNMQFLVTNLPCEAIASEFGHKTYIFRWLTWVSNNKKTALIKMASHEQTTNAELKDMITKLIGKVDTVSSDVKHLSHRLSKVEKSVESLEGQVRTQLRDDSASNVQTMLNAQGAMFENVTTDISLSVKFYGLGHKQHQQTMPLDVIFRHFMVEVLNIDQDTAFAMAIQVQQLPRMSQRDVHSPLCVTFRSSDDRDLIAKRAEKYKKSKLRVLGISLIGFQQYQGTYRQWYIG